MAGKPTFKNNDAQLECICDSTGKPKKLKLASWVNPKKADQYDEAKLAACEKIRNLVYENDLQFRIKFTEAVDDDYNNDKDIGAVNIFANKPYVAPEDRQAAPAAAQQGGGFGSFGK